MPKKVWISLPLITSSEAGDASIVSFLKGGVKKNLEVEVAAFITKSLMDKNVPFGIDFDSCGVDRALVIEALPKRLQKILGAAIPLVAEPGEVAPSEVAGQVEEADAIEHAAEVQKTAQVEQPGAAVEVAEVEEVAADLVGGDGGPDGSSEPR